MRKVLVPVLVASVATVPAVALAATTDNQANADAAASASGSKHELRTDAKLKRRNAAKIVKHERTAKARKRAAATPAASASPQLQAIAACESGGNPRAIGGGGAFRGKYQFDYGTWASVGGTGDPASASEAEQDYRAGLLLARSGTAPWPVCGR
ncbi:MAG: resuscitation-promoting factor RpfE [Thermoleophilaceae bacterium]|nr:resuscitation-promoting factor RpfE [Thermoleophilaceae bacterium]MEA2470535.1 resuscitation-promoting factor RpfE [Thermoleophilaceae bacterium]